MPTRGVPVARISHQAAENVGKALLAVEDLERSKIHCVVQACLSRFRLNFVSCACSRDPGEKCWLARVFIVNRHDRLEFGQHFEPLAFNESGSFANAFSSFERHNDLSDSVATQPTNGLDHGLHTCWPIWIHISGRWGFSR